MFKTPLNIVLHENQQLIHDSPARNIVVKSGKRFGKTVLAVYKLIKWAGDKKGTYWYIAPTYAQAESIAWRKLKELIPVSLIRRIVENKLYVELVNGSVIQLKGADNEDSLRGTELNGVILDEAAYINKYLWNNILRGQLLGVNGQEPGYSMFISSPINPFETVGKNITDWYTDFFNETLRKKLNGDKDWDAYHFTIYDNPLLTKEQIDEIRADASEDEFNIEYLAKESVYGGTLYSEFSFDRDVKEMPKEGKLIRGIDWGMAHPTVCLFVYVENKSKIIYFEDEYVKSDSSIPESCETIVKMTNQREVEWTVCDPSLNKRNSVTKLPDLVEFNRNGVLCQPGDNNSRGYSIAKMFFKNGHIRINPKCRNLIKQIKTLQYSSKVGDDCTDVLRYICVRVHDLIFKWNEVTNKEDLKEEFGSFNINDKFLFPGHVKQNKVLEDIRSF